jgi:hypothetical protein
MNLNNIDFEDSDDLSLSGNEMKEESQEVMD